MCTRDAYGQPHGPTQPWGALRERLGYPATGVHVIAERMADGYVPPSTSLNPDATVAPPAGTRKATLVEAYWKLRDHAAAYRRTKGFRKAFERWEANRDDERLHRRAAIHEFYAKGIEASARGIAEMLGVPEHEIERPEVAK